MSMRLRVIEVKRPGLVLICWILARFLPAQQPAWQLELAYTQGNFYSHPAFRSLPSRPLRSFDLSVSRPANGAAYWQQLHHYPDMGLRFRVRDMADREVYGHVFSLIPHLKFYPVRKEKWGAQVAHGTGLCYITRIFHDLRNPSNRLISSHINAATFLSAGLYFQPKPAWTVAATLEFSHESNGNFKINNRGFNVWSAGIAVRRNWNTPVERQPRRLPSGPFQRWLFSMELGCGFHDYNDFTREMQLTPEFVAAGWRQHNERFRTYLGLGYSIYPFPLIDRAGFVLLGEEVLLGRLSVRYSLGTYLGNTGPRFRLIEKVGISYYPFKNHASVAKGLYFGSCLKAHGQVAAHIEFMVGNVF